MESRRRKDSVISHSRNIYWVFTMYHEGIALSIKYGIYSLLIVIHRSWLIKAISSKTKDGRMLLPCG